MSNRDRCARPGHRLDHLMRHVSPEPNTGCWLWTAAVDTRGYGVITISPGDGTKKTLKAHRVSYELHVKTIPHGLVIDHLCRVRSCVNPAHLEAVTVHENTMRSPVAVTAVLARQMVCRYGHEFSRRSDGHRGCRTCKRTRETRRRSKEMATTEPGKAHD